MNPLCKGQFNKDRVPVTLTAQEERENFLKSQPRNKKEQEVAIQTEIY